VKHKWFAYLAERYLWVRNPYPICRFQEPVEKVEGLAGCSRCSAVADSSIFAAARLGGGRHARRSWSCWPGCRADVRDLCCRRNVSCEMSFIHCVKPQLHRLDKVGRCIHLPAAAHTCLTYPLLGTAPYNSVASPTYLESLRKLSESTSKTPAGTRPLEKACLAEIVVSVKDYVCRFFFVGCPLSHCIQNDQNNTTSSWPPCLVRTRS
jgi:hypothetical protein